MGRTSRLAALLVPLVLCVPPSARSADDDEEPPRRQIPFSDDTSPPPALPVPLDRHLVGEITKFDGDRISLSWAWSDPAQLEDFERFVPVRATLKGGFRWADGVLEARGTGGIRLKLGFKNHVRVKVAARLVTPHDLGVVLAKPDTSDESILCLIQDKFFTRFDRAAGNANMINKMGAVPPTEPGVVEFRYVDRKKPPTLVRSQRVTFDVERKKDVTQFIITPEGEDPVTLEGKDPSPPFFEMSPGLYVSGGAADFGPLEVEGKLDPAWFRDNDVLPHISANLLHPGNRFSGNAKRAAKLVEEFLAQPALEERRKEGEEAPKRIEAEAVAKLLGRKTLPLVIRIRAAEALVDKGFEGGRVQGHIAHLMDTADLEGRVLAWQVLRPKLPWHFDYDPTGEAKARREAALLVADYLGRREEELAQQKVFVEGYWYTVSRADAIRAEWPKSWDLRSPRVRVRTNLPKAWADWYLGALEAEYAQMVELLGREPPRSQLPLSVFVFMTKEDYAAFCKDNGYEKKAAWGRFVDLERGVGFVTFNKKQSPQWAMAHMAKLFLRSATGRYWPTWYDEGRASWFGSGDYKTAKWKGGVLEVGLMGSGSTVRRFRRRAREDQLWDTETFLGHDPRNLDTDQRRSWYVYAWAFHHWLVSEASDDVRRRVARWQGVIENVEVGGRTIDAWGTKQFLSILAPRMDEIDREFLAWVKSWP